MEVNLHKVKNLCPLYPLEKKPMVPTDGSLLCRYSGFGRCGEENISFLPGIEPRFPLFSLQYLGLCIR
jgi:hypothetical protein